MSYLSSTYRDSLSLHTDLYQITMAYGYWKQGMAEREAVFHLFYRTPPFGGSYALSAGLATAVEWLDQFQPSPEDLAYLGELSGNDGKPLFDPAFLEFVANTPFRCDIDAIPEGEVAFGQCPILRVRGPLYQAQWIETPLLNIINFQTLIATKTARIRRAAEDDAVLEFGMRRAQGIDGALAVARGAWVGGVDATSNVLAGHRLGLPVKGTHAHAWVMAHDDEQVAFDHWAEAMPNNAIFLVDTYDTVEGVRKAIATAKKMKEKGHTALGIRLDSGDMTALSRAARKLLDDAGLPEMKIVASSDLDEYRIQEMKEEGAQIDIWGVGTRLATAYDQPALGGVYKLAAIRTPNDTWEFRMKLSENPAKSTLPGILQLRRYYRDGKMVADVLYNEEDGVDESRLHPLSTPEVVMQLPPYDRYENLLAPTLRKGKKLSPMPDVHLAREKAQRCLAQLPEEVAQLDNPETYPVFMDHKLYLRRQSLRSQKEATT